MLNQRMAMTAIVVAALGGSGSLLAQSAGFTVDLTWTGTKSCFDPQSPPFSLSGVPVNTRMLRFAMHDLDAPNFVHGGGTVSYDGQPRIPRGAFSYRGPCPPHGQHRYQWTVDALDAAGRTTGNATVTKKFPLD